MIVFHAELATLTENGIPQRPRVRANFHELQCVTAVLGFRDRLVVGSTPDDNYQDQPESADEQQIVSHSVEEHEAMSRNGTRQPQESPANCDSYSEYANGRSGSVQIVLPPDLLTRPERTSLFKCFLEI
jgi:hypothetical protein